MINVFYKNRNTIGQFMVALMFLGTFGFLFTYDGFVSESTAAGCCGGGEAAVTSFAADSSGDYGSDIPMDAESSDGCRGEMDTLSDSSESNSSESNCFSCIDDGQDCTVCPNYKDCGISDQPGCPSDSGCNNSKDSCTCDSWICDMDTDCGGGC